MNTLLPTQLHGGPFAVATRGLVKKYGRVAALDHLDLQVPEGAVYVLVGPNGAGKSSTLKTLLDLARPDRGVAEVFGLDARTLGQAVRAQIGYVPERLDWGYGWMHVGRLLQYQATYYPSWDREYAATLTRAFRLHVDRRFSSLSKGEGRRVHLLMALAHRPPLLILDEPTDGLDPVVLDETLGILTKHIAETPTTVLISTHRVHEVDRLADHVGVMRDGKLILQTHREDLYRKLRWYRAEVPEWWTGAPQLDRAVLRKSNLGREIRWVIWGEEPDVVEHLTRVGAAVQGAAPMSLEEATLTLLNRGDQQ